MNQPRPQGNTLSEYLIIISLILLTSIAALKLLGNSITGNYHEVTQSHSGQTLHQMSKINFNGSASVTPNKVAPSSNQANSNLGLQLVNSSSIGVNATSIDGIKDTPTGQAYLTAQQLKHLADKVTDQALKASLQEAADLSFKLSASQASVELLQNNDQTGTMAKLVSSGGLNEITIVDSVNSVDQYRMALENKLQSLESISSSNQNQLTQAKQLVSGVVTSSWQQYGPLIDSTDTYQAKTYNPNVAGIQPVAETALQSGTLTNTPAIEQSIQTGLTLKSP